MKLVKLSLATIVALAGVAQAEIKDVKFGGNAKIWYETFEKDANPDNEFFQKHSASGQAAMNISADAVTSSGTKLHFLNTTTSTLGLENNLVSSIRMGQDANTSLGESPLDTQNWFSEATVTLALPGKTAAILGRQYLDTPLAYSEKWNLVSNSFDAAVFANSALKDVTIIGAYVGKGNGTAGSYNAVAYDGLTTTFANKGAYALAVLAKPAGISVNAWYYNLPSHATATWLDVTIPAGPVKIKAIYSGINVDDGTRGKSAKWDSSAAALEVSAKILKGVNFSVAYSTIDDDGDAGFNTATGKKTKLPTATVYGDAKTATKAGTDSLKVKVVAKIGDSTKIITQFGSYEYGEKGNAYSGKWGARHTDSDSSREFDLIIATKALGLNFKALYMTFDHITGQTEEHVRAIVSTKF
jgi:hypothetical protein